MVILFLSLLGVTFVSTLGFMLWLATRARPEGNQPQANGREGGQQAPAGLPWRYVVLPAALFLFSLLLVAPTYPAMPQRIATHFNVQGVADGWMNKTSATAGILGLQAFLLVLGFLAVYSMARVSGSGNGPATPGRLMPLAGNLVVLPQVILFLVTLDTIWYNLWQGHLLPGMSLLMATGIIAVAGPFFLLLLARRTRQGNKIKEGNSR